MGSAMLSDHEIDAIAERVADKLAARNDRRRSGKKYLKKSEVARLLGVDRSTVRRWIKKGMLKETSLGIPEREIDTLCSK